MSRPRYYWYGIVKKMVSRYLIIREETSYKSAEYTKAIESAIDETRKLPNGDMRIYAIEQILWKKTKTYYGVADELCYEVHTVQSWVSAFIRMVGHKVGF